METDRHSLTTKNPIFQKEALIWKEFIISNHEIHSSYAAPLYPSVDFSCPDFCSKILTVTQVKFFALEYAGVVFLAEAIYPASRFRLRPLMKEVKWSLLSLYT
jgi:hypothetical protein